MSFYAFEPHPQTYGILKKNIKSNNVELLNFSIGDINEKVKLYDYKSNDGSSHASVYKDVIEKIHGCESISHDVAMITLDDFCLNRDIKHIDLLKIDVEGNEFKVLNGASHCIKAGIIKAIHFEFNEMNVLSRTFFNDFQTMLSDYTFYRMLPNGLLKMDKYVPLYFEIFAYQNIVAFKN